MSYSAQEVARLSDTNYRTLMRWVNEGLLRPEGANRGYGWATTWEAKDVREASILSALRRAGFSLQRLREAIEYLRSLGHNPLSTGEFIVVKRGDGAPKDVIKLCDTGEAMALLKDRGQLVFPIWVAE